VKDVIAARRYAISVIANVKQENIINLIAETKIIKSVLLENPKFSQIMRSKIVSDGYKKDLFKTIIHDFILEELWLSFFDVLLQKNREGIIVHILDEIIKQVYMSDKAKLVDLILAFRHDDDTIRKIAQSVEQEIGCKIIYNVLIDSEIIGGFIAKSEDFIIDSSIIGNLNQFVNNHS
jgi:ATP synthase F1 delta subunit